MLVCLQFAALLLLYVFLPAEKFDEGEVAGLLLFTLTATPLLLRGVRQQQSLEGAYERLRVTLRSIGDAVIVTDDAGRVEFLNPVAEHLTGWPVGEARAKPLPEVFRIVNEHTRAPAENPVERVLREGYTVGLANHTALIRRDGAEFSIADSAAPIIDAGHRIRGVVMVFRDVTAERSAERELDDERQIFVGGPAVVFRWRNEPGWPVEYVSPNLTAQFGHAPADLVSGRLRYADLIHPEDRARVAAEVEHYSQVGLPLFEQNYRLRSGGGEYRWVYDFTRAVRDDRGRLTHYHGYLLDVTERKTATGRLKETSERLAALIEALPDVVFFKDGEGHWLITNTVAQRLFRLQGVPWCGKNEMELSDLQPGLREAHLACKLSDDAAWAARRLTEGMEIIADPESGEPRHWHVVKQPLFEPDGSRKGLVIIGHDVTARVRSEEDLRLAACVFDHNSEGIVITNRDATILRVNAAFSRITGYTAEEVVGKNPNILRSPRHDSLFYADMWRSLAEQGQWRGEIWNRRKNGDIYPEWLVISAVKDAGGGVTHYAGVFSDITDLKKAEETIHHLAYYDALTELPNRPLLMDRLKVAIAATHRAGEAIAVLFIDLDRFKSVNDSLGHASGDLLLRQTAERLAGAVREGDTVARLGGDEFVVVLNHIGSNDEAMFAATTVAEKVRAAFSRAFMLKGFEHVVTPSIGIALYPADGTTPEELIRNADTAMYHAKAQGRDNYQFYRQEMNETALARLMLESDLRHAVERGDLKLVYQPQVEIGTGRVIGVEALLRWQHPRIGWIPPTDFIPIAEETGLIERIGEWVIEEAALQKRTWATSGLCEDGKMRIAVNVSPRQFRHPAFADNVARILGRTCLDPAYLDLELTEDSLLRHTEETLRTLDRLKALGLSVTVDDFGTGYSSLSYLKRFPIDVLKIDRSFVRDIGIDPNDAAIVTAIVSMARALGLKTIAVGVETQEQLDFLKEAGCWACQGYLFKPPSPPQELETLLRQRQLPH